MLPAQLEYLLKLDKKQSKIFRSWYSHEICLPPAGPFGNPEKARVIDLVEKFVNNFEQKVRKKRVPTLFITCNSNTVTVRSLF